MQVKSIAECSKGSILQYFQAFIKLSFVIKIFVLPIFEWPFNTCFTVPQANPWLHQGESKSDNSGMIFSKATSSLFPSKMIAKLERTHSAAKQNIDLAQAPNKQWEQQTMNKHNSRTIALEGTAAKATTSLNIFYWPNPHPRFCCCKNT